LDGVQCVFGKRRRYDWYLWYLMRSSAGLLTITAGPLPYIHACEQRSYWAADAELTSTGIHRRQGAGFGGQGASPGRHDCALLRTGIRWDAPPKGRFARRRRSPGAGRLRRELSMLAPASDAGKKKKRFFGGWTDWLGCGVDPADDSSRNVFPLPPSSQRARRSKYSLRWRKAYAAGYATAHLKDLHWR